jgi:hypothetical protein
VGSIAKRNIHCVLSDVAEGMITGWSSNDRRADKPALLAHRSLCALHSNPGNRGMQKDMPNGDIDQNLSRDRDIVARRCPILHVAKPSPWLT